MVMPAWATNLFLLIRAEVENIDELSGAFTFPPKPPLGMME
jgi:hypothetical protein